jgi:tetratricopeptide (TPR) repeat protein
LVSYVPCVVRNRFYNGRCMSRSTAVAGTLVLLGATILAYLPALRAGFIWDDDAYVTENATLRTADGLRRIWTQPGAVPQYYPLVHTTFWLEYHAWGLNPVGFHAVNVLLHAVNAVLVWQVLRRLELRGAWWVAAVFALHPVHVESVVWITERKNVLSGLFYLLALLAYLRFRPLRAPDPIPLLRREGAGGGSEARPKNHKNPLPTLPRGGGGIGQPFYILALLAYVAALLSKTVTCSLPAALLLLTWWKRGRLSWRDAVPLVPMFVLGAGLSVLTISMEMQHVGALGPEWALSFLGRVLVAGRAVWFYVGKLLWPAHLAFIYERWAIDTAVWWQYLYPLGAVLLVVALVLLRRRLGRGPLVAALFFGGTLLPALGFINVYPMRYSYVADHFQYLASLGIITLVIGAAAAWLGSRRVAPVLGAALLVALGVCVWRQGRIYDNLETLWRDTLAKSPTAYIASNNLGVELDRQGRSQDAIPYLEAALRRRADDVSCINNLANAYGHVGRIEEALRTYASALERDPTSAMTHFNLGTMEVQAGRLDAGIRHLNEALRLNPRQAAARKNLAQALLQLAGKLLNDGDPHAAITQYRACLAVQADNVEALNALAWLLATDPDAGARRGQEAVTLAERATQLTRSEDPAVLDTLAAALAETGQFGRALAVARQARASAERLGAASLVTELDGRIQLYATKTPYHAPVQTAPASRP